MRGTLLRIFISAAMAASGSMIEVQQASAAPVISSSKFKSIQIPAQKGAFALDFDMIASGDNIDGVTGLSRSAAKGYSDNAVAIRFSTGGKIEAMNGNTYAAATSISYSAGQKFHVRMEIDIAAKTYSVQITPPQGNPVVLASNYKFRKEQAQVSSLRSLNLISSVGTHQVDDVVLGSLSSPGPIPPSSGQPQLPSGPSLTSSTSWQRTSIAAQSGSFALDFDMIANGDNIDGVTGLSSSAAKGYSDNAVAIRFSTGGKIEALNGSAYAAATSISYVSGQTFHVRMEINIPAKKYTVKVTPPNGTPITLGTNLSFRNEQAQVSTLDTVNFIAAAGSHRISNLVVSALSGQPAPPASNSPPPTPTPVPPSQNPPSTAGIIYRATFDKWPVGSTYDVSKAKSDFGSVGSVANPSLGVIVNGSNAYSGNALRTAYPAGKIGGGTSLQFEAKLPKSYDEIYYSFRIRFDPNFNFVKGGKLTGVCGGACNTGGSTPSGYDGWSARLMWTKNFGLDRLVDQYIYHVGQPTQYGNDLYYQVNGKYPQFAAGQWYTIEWRVKMNTPGQNDGIIQSWINGQMAVNKNIRYRMNNAFSIDKYIFSTFFGGGDSSWAPPSTQYIYWDDITISTQPITH